MCLGDTAIKIAENELTTCSFTQPVHVKVTDSALHSRLHSPSYSTRIFVVLQDLVMSNKPSILSKVLVQSPPVYSRKTPGTAATSCQREEEATVGRECSNRAVRERIASECSRPVEHCQ